jgi:hypothetical protein
LETYRQRAFRILPGVEQTLPPTDLGGALEEQPTAMTKTARRIAYCECGAQLAGESDSALFVAVQQHLAHNHPQLLGALEPDVVCQMAEIVGTGASEGVRGQST